MYPMHALVELLMGNGPAPQQPSPATPQTLAHRQTTAEAAPTAPQSTEGLPSGTFTPGRNGGVPAVPVAPQAPPAPATAPMPTEPATGGSGVRGFARRVGGGMANLSPTGGDPYLAFAQGFGGSQAYGMATEEAELMRAIEERKLRIQERNAARQGQPQYGNPVWGTDPGTGRPVLGMTGSDGSFRRVDIGQFQPEQTPLSPAGKLEADFRGGRLSEDTFNQAKTGIGRPGVEVNMGSELPKPPSGFSYRFNADGTPMYSEDGVPMLAPIPGGPEDTTAEDATAAENRETSAGIVLDEISLARDIINNAEWPTTGLVGSALSAIDSTEAGALKNRLTTIRANLGFDKLQSMRDASPTGGALGQVSEFENRLLQAVFGSLEQAQRKEDVIYNLQRLEDIYTRIIHEGIEDSEARALYRQEVTGQRQRGDTGSAGTGTTTGGINWSIEQ